MPAIELRPERRASLNFFLSLPFYSFFDFIRKRPLRIEAVDRVQEITTNNGKKKYLLEFQSHGFQCQIRISPLQFEELSSILPPPIVLTPQQYRRQMQNRIKSDLLKIWRHSPLTVYLFLMAFTLFLFDAIQVGQTLTPSPDCDHVCIIKLTQNYKFILFGIIHLPLGFLLGIGYFLLAQKTSDFGRSVRTTQGEALILLLILLTMTSAISKRVKERDLLPSMSVIMKVGSGATTPSEGARQLRQLQEKGP